MKIIKEFITGEKNIIVNTYWNQDYIAPGYVQYKDIEEEFKTVISGYNANCEAHVEGFGNIPIIRIVAGCETWTMAMAYGCEMVLSGL